eukprot:Nitzschia sp. Nitz4//scaffold354_size22159//17089//18510//NITZ4_008579-RA/size22159-processed-gene-0.19-mRNA-1//-1//CDS//3329548938//723//frame0
MVELLYSTVIQQAEWIRQGKVTCRELVNHCLERIDELDPQLNAFCYVLHERARAEADARDSVLANGEAPLGPLHGVPIAIKDDNHVAGLPTAYGGGGFTSIQEKDSAIVQRLRQAGAVIIGKTRMPEFGIWPFTETELHGVTKNPWNLDKSPAGSSGGSAVAVAAGMVAAAIGSDGGGSIRLPSSWCGLVGLKTQLGRVSTAPNACIWTCLGVLGPLTQTVADAALICDAIHGNTATDMFPAESWEAGTSLSEAIASSPSNLRIGVSMANPMGGPIADEETQQAVRNAAKLLEEQGHTVVEVDNPDYPIVTLTFNTLVSVGIGDELQQAEHPERLEYLTRSLNTLMSPLRWFKSYAVRSAKQIADEFIPKLFSNIDVLLTPTTVTAALDAGQLSSRSMLDVLPKSGNVCSYTAFWNLARNPAVAVPTGLNTQGLPLSVQVVVPSNMEPLALAIASQLESLLGFVGTHPSQLYS